MQFILRHILWEYRPAGPAVCISHDVSAGFRSAPNPLSIFATIGGEVHVSDSFIKARVHCQQQVQELTAVVCFTLSDFVVMVGKPEVHAT
jgi:hypothetical protein